MSDITERLRHFCTRWDGGQMGDHADPMPGLRCTELREAAAEIDRLRAQVAAMREACKTSLCVLSALKDANDWHPNMTKDIVFAIDGNRAAIDRARKSGDGGQG